MLRNIGLWALLVFGVCAANGCSSDGGGGGAGGVDAGDTCNTNPKSCGAGTTCWLTESNTFACLPAGAANKGEPCIPYQGIAQCNAGLFCFDNLNTPEADGACVSFCEDQSCAAGEACVQAQFVGVPGKVSLCIPTGQPPADGGTGGSAGAAGSGGMAGAGGSAGSGATAGEGGNAGSSAGAAGADGG
jgi:hypothetical protein